MATPTSRSAQLQDMLAFIADQVLQFWPPYRIEEERESSSQLAPVRVSAPRRARPRGRLAQSE